MNFDLWALAALIALTLLCAAALSTQHQAEERLCRHAIQRTFGKTAEQAQSIIDDTRKWERE